MEIGNKIRELRKASGMTQEQLAAALSISFQSVSKWETGLTLPDLSMIPGLTRLLGVTADELLGLTGKEAEKRRDFFQTRYLDSMSRPYDKEDLTLAKQAVGEFPGDPRYLYWLAHAEFFDGFENGLNRGDRACFQKKLEQSLAHALTVFDMTDEETLRTKALFHIVQTLVSLDRKAEARHYAELYPSSCSVSKEDVLALCAEEEDICRLQQEQIKSGALKLLQDLLNYWRGKDLHEKSVRAAFAAAADTVYALIPDGNYLEFHDLLFHVCAARAVLAGYDGRQAEMIDALRQAKKHAVSFGSLFGGGEQRYTSPLFDRCSVNLPTLPPQYQTPIQEFQELLKKNTFDPYRDSAEFLALAE